MSEAPTERPTIHGIIAKPGLAAADGPLTTRVIDFLEWPIWKMYGWELLALDPDDLDRWHAWRRQNPNAA